MSVETLLAQAADADKSADAIFARADAARGNSTALRVAGFESELERASDLRRRARALRAEATQESLPPARIASPAALHTNPESTAPASAPAFNGVAGVVDAAEETARKIIAAAELAEGLGPAAYPLSEAEEAAAMVARALQK